MKKINRDYWDWENIDIIPSQAYICYKCNNKVASNQGYNCFGNSRTYKGNIYICPNCKSPTYFIDGEQIPAPMYGNTVGYLPSDVLETYEEARKCFSVNAYTSVVLCCRKLLMHIACEIGAKEGEKFGFYVDYLDNEGYIPPNGKSWVDKIRKLGNEATHMLEVKSKEDAQLAINFTGMLLKFIYEMPKML